MSIEPKYIPVLDHGYVELVDVMGGDLSVVNAARASFGKRSAALEERDERLIRFLIKNDHLSPFRHAFVQFEIRAPLMVCRQHWKYVVGSDHTLDSWNELSRRYVTEEPEFYIPAVWRSTPEHKKQGSGPPVQAFVADVATAELQDSIEVGLERYHHAIEQGICVEQARGFLPAYFMYTNYWWSASLQSVMHFLTQRLADDAQVELQEYAKAIRTLVQPHFPVSFDVFGVHDAVAGE